MNAAERIAELKAERDRARATAVALEQQLARVSTVLAPWEEIGADQSDPLNAIVWAVAHDVRAALEGEAP